MAAARTKESQVGPSPAHTSRYPSRSAIVATRSGSSTGLSSSRATATTLKSKGRRYPAERAATGVSVRSAESSSTIRPMTA